MPPVGSETLVRGEMPQATNEVRLNGSRYLEQPTVRELVDPGHSGQARVRDLLVDEAGGDGLRGECVQCEEYENGTASVQHGWLP